MPNLKEKAAQCAHFLTACDAVIVAMLIILDIFLRQHELAIKLIDVAILAGIGILIVGGAIFFLIILGIAMVANEADEIFAAGIMIATIVFYKKDDLGQIGNQISSIISGFFDLFNYWQSYAALAIGIVAVYLLHRGYHKFKQYINA
jgi:hypothetical protein